MPEVLWPFTEEVIKNIKLLGFSPPRVDAHDKGDNEGSDFIFGKVSPHLTLSEGEYMRIDQDQGLFSYDFGTRGCCGGDPTYGGEVYFEPTKEKAKALADAFIEQFFTEE